MAQQLPCDICREEIAVQMLTNLATGDTMTLGPSCLAQFYGQSVLTLLEAGYHKGPAGKCQACRRFHEQMTLPTAPAAVEPGLETGPEEPRTEDSQAVDPA